MFLLLPLLLPDLLLPGDLWLLPDLGLLWLPLLPSDLLLLALPEDQ